MTRSRLDARRYHETVEFRHGSLACRGGLGFFPDGSIAEIFLNLGKAGSDSDVNARDAAISASLAMQHGCPAEVLRDALTRNSDGSAASPLGALLDIVTEGEAQ